MGGSMARRYLVWDLGATKCAAAVVLVDSSGFRVERTASLLLSSVSSLASMASCLHQKLQLDLAEISGICIAAAGCYDGAQLHLASGYPFSMCFAEVARVQQWPDFSVVHDYTPVVASTFVYEQTDDAVLMLRSSPVDRSARRVAFGVGTGLGLKDALAVPSGELWFGENEAGHIGVTLPPDCDPVRRELFQDFMRFLSSELALKSTSVTFETVLSGGGFAAIFRYFSRSKTAKTPEIAQIEMEQNDLYRQQTLGLLGWFLGLFVGTLELVFMPKGGIWIGGGVIKKNLALFSEDFLDDFWSGVACSPAYTLQRETFPIGVLKSDHSIYVGGAFYAHNMCAQKL
jgi:glucokinase